MLNYIVNSICLSLNVLYPSLYLINCVFVFSAFFDIDFLYPIYTAAINAVNKTPHTTNLFYIIKNID